MEEEVIKDSELTSTEAESAEITGTALTDYYFEQSSTASEDIGAAYTALMAIDIADPGMTDNMDEYIEKKRQVNMMAMDIIYMRLLYIKDGIIDESTESE
jgi:hypothetical protein